MDKPVKKDLTLKQRKWIKEYLSCGNASEAAMKVYSVKDRESAGQIGYENLKKLDYSDFLEEAGISDVLIQQKIMEGLDATRTVSARVIVQKNRPTSQADGELPLADSKTDDFIDVPDFIARHKYLETVLKLKKRLGVENQTNIQVNIQPILGELKAE